ncbi:MAG: AI-2E family transporter [Bacteroidetes bacterium]|nr:MAG: AI-2E family transporter [Bacteroidota bacterium]
MKLPLFIKQGLAFLFVLFLSYFTKGFLMPLAIGGILATLFLPLCKWLERKNIYKGLAALICLLVLVILIVSAIGILSWEIAELTTDFALIKQKAIKSTAKVQDYILNHFGISLEKQAQIVLYDQPSIGGIMQLVGGSFTYILTNFVLVLAYVFLLLYYRIHLRQFVFKLTIKLNQEKMMTVIYGAAHVSQQYLIGLAKMIVFLWMMYGIGFGMLGVKNAIFFAILCGLLEIIPFIGNITGTALTLFVSAAHGASLTLLGGIVVTYAIVQFIQGWILEPVIVGRQVKINPLFTIIALVLGELVWGIPGVFLAIPMLAMFKTTCDHFETLKPYGFLIGEVQNNQTELSIIEKVKKLL